MSTATLLTEEWDEATVLVTLNRPDRRNALTIELMQSLCHTLETLAAEPQRRVLILTGAGSAFCAGLDLIEAADLSVAEHSAEWVARTLKTLWNSPLVTIAAVDGAAFAGGAGLLACCDLVVASDVVRIGFPEVRRGLVPALVSVVLRQRLRDRDLRELLLLAEPIDALRALDIGLVNRVVPQNQLNDEVRSLAATILKGAPEAVRQTKRLLREATAKDFAQNFERALAIHRSARLSAEAREGLAAFQERREVDWSRPTT